MWVGGECKTYIDHSIGSDSEECGPFVDRLDFGRSLVSAVELFEVSECTLQGRPVLADEVAARVQVLKFRGQRPQCVL